MQPSLHLCLFDLWVQESAPIVHMSAFWPSFSEQQILGYIADAALPEPIALKPLQTAAALTAKTKIEAFLALIAALPESEYPCKPVYIEYERERLAALSMVLNTTEPLSIASANDELFGTLASLDAQAIVGYLAHHIDMLSPNSAATAGARDTVLQAMKSVERDTSLADRIASIEDYRHQLRIVTRERYGFIDTLVDLDAAPPEGLPSIEVQAVMDRALAEILGTSIGTWRALVQPDAPNVFIDYSQAAIIIPAHRHYRPAHLRSLIIHEIGVHVLRAVNGSQSQERLAGYGLTGYGPAEEALGVLLGSTAKHTSRQLISLIPFAVINFADQTPAPSFREVYEFTKALYITLDNPSDQAFSAAEPRYARSAFSRVIRILRLGRAGFIDRSTTKYWRGQLLLSAFFDSRGLNQAVLDEFFLGKYDCLNSAQLNLIKHHTPAPQ